MAQLKMILLIAFAMTIVACSAESTRYRQRLTVRKIQPLRQRLVAQQKRVLARQEAVTPYPSADELKPEVPFEEGIQPDEVYGPPDETYGPPEIDETIADQLPSEEAPEEFAPNPDAEEFQPAVVESLALNRKKQGARLSNNRNANKKIISSRLVQKKRTQKSQPLVLALANPYTAQYQQYYLPNQPFAYTSQYQAW